MLLEQVEVGEALMLPPEGRGEIQLPEKDWPILGGAEAGESKSTTKGSNRR